MCTVSIIYKGNNDFVLTSNRDEAPSRKALALQAYLKNDTEIVMPKDITSGGSWIGTSKKNLAICLLNGAHTAHKRKPSYKESRGIVVTNLLAANNIASAINTYNFNGIEPFTMVIVDWNSNLKFYELVWNETKALFKQLPLEEKIWSSAMLYSKYQEAERQCWFNTYLSKQELSAKTLLEFHETAGSGNKDYGVIIDRDFVKTTSITQIEKTNNSIEIRFRDLNTNNTSIKKLNTLTS